LNKADVKGAGILASLPVGREVKESSHSFGFAQDKLLCGVRNGPIRPSLQDPFFRTLLEPRGEAQAVLDRTSTNVADRSLIEVEFSVPFR
jgi:hypothetical protein